jgi:hypothetical protein
VIHVKGKGAADTGSPLHHIVKPVDGEIIWVGSEMDYLAEEDSKVTL